MNQSSDDMKKHNPLKPILALLGSLLLNVACAQDNFKTAVGLRTGLTSGITFKYGLKNNAALETIVGVRPYSSNFTMLYEVNNPTGESGLRWYYGAGAHLSLYNNNNYYPWRGPYWKAPDYYNYNTFGVDLALGLEYKIPKAPLALSFDVKPFFEFYPYNRVYSSLDPGLGIKVTF